ncbi:DNA modification methylase [Microbacterium protaetiae]|uniref:DNA modification methylase n=1 Tax=Microbacterium protaetiae TaxID=2509458 RepID=A0A4P6ECM2_9MICO|nr:DNA modification methylase [Microbacterium protaetiae]QAY58759.1 DNA modification methylase [Microbacterium protaetiae]
MKSRLLASIAVCATVILGATGCSMISPQGTTIPYSPSDGINIADTTGAPLQVRNALIVATDDGTIGNLIAAVVNTTAEDQTLTVEVDAASGKITQTVRVAAHSVSSLGQNVDPLRLDNLGVKPGLTVPVYFQSGDAEGALANLPVLGGDEQYLSGLVPEPAPTPDATPAS